MDIYLDNTYINAKEVYNVFFNYKPEKKITRTGRLWWKKVKEVNVEKWEIMIEYLNGSGNVSRCVVTGSNKNLIENDFKNLIEQLKTYGSQWADKALENAIINGGSK